MDIFREYKRCYMQLLEGKIEEKLGRERYEREIQMENIEMVIVARIKK